MASTITADNGVSSGSAGLKSSADSSGVLALATGTGTTAVTIDASQNVGIGTSSPVFGNGSGLQVSRAGTATVRVTDSTDSNSIEVVADATGVMFDARGNIPMRFNNTGGERARIDASGNLLVGATAQVNNEKFLVVQPNQAYSQTIKNSNANPNGLYFVYSGASPNNTANEFIYINDSTTTRFTLRSNGGIANYSANNVNLSDRREKTNFTPAKSYLDAICAIPVQTYNYIDQNLEEDAGLTLGVVAQDVQAVAPELVTESNWGTKEKPKMRLSIYQTDLQYALMKCIQEQQALINAQQAALTTLTERITALEAK